MNELISSAPLLIQATILTLEIATLSMALALPLGLILTLLRTTRFRALRLGAAAYVQFFRGLPLIASLFWIYFGITIAFNLSISAFSAGVLAIGLGEAALFSEVARSAFDAIPATQTAAGLSLGMSSFRVFLDVRLPQAVKIMVPIVGNEYIQTVKGSALVSLLGVTELMRTTQQLVFFYELPFVFYTAAGMIYIALALIIGVVFLAGERSLTH